MLELILISFVSGLTTFIGVTLAILLKKRKRGIALAMGFASGIMLAICFLGLIPESIKLASWFIVALFFILGFLILMFLDFWLPHSHFIKEKGKTKKLIAISFLIALGMILHDFPEGFAIAASWSIQRNFGILIALSVALHNIPEEFALALPLVLVKKRRLLFGLAAASTLAEPAGAVLGILSIYSFPQIVPYLLAFVAGVMAFIVFDELIPLAREFYKGIYFPLGVVFGVLIYVFLDLLF